jgi:hypothetical protein
MATYNYDIATYFPNGLNEQSLALSLRRELPSDTEPHGLRVIGVKSDRSPSGGWDSGAFTLETARALTAPEQTSLEAYFLTHSGGSDYQEWKVDVMGPGVRNGELRWCLNASNVGYVVYWDVDEGEWRDIRNRATFWP